MIHIDKLTLKNFLSHRDSQLSISDREGLVLIAGQNTSGYYDSNGSGKSTILEGIVYALTGNTLRGLAVNDVVNRNAKKDTCVSLDFHIDDKCYRVLRYRQDTKEGDKLYIQESPGENPTQLTKRLNKDTQKLLDSLIDIPYTVLVNTIFLGEGMSSRFTQLSDAEKKSLIESTLNLSYDLGKCKDKTTERLKSLKLERSRLQGEQSAISAMLSSDISNVDGKIAEQRNLSEQCQRDIISHQEEYQKSASLLEHLAIKINTLQTSSQEYHTLDNQLKDLDERVAHLVTEVGEIEGSSTPLCTLCRQKLIGHSKELVLEEYKTKIRQGTEQMRIWQSQLDKLPDISLIDSTLSNLQEEYRKSQESMYLRQQQISSLQSTIDTTQKSIQYLDSLAKNKEEYQAKYTQVSNDIVNISKEISAYEYLQKLFSPTGIITYVLEEAIHYINLRIQEYTSILLDKSYQLVLQNSKISLEDSKGSTYASLSNGEKRRLDIAIQFSLHDYTHVYCGVGTNVLFIDEILDTLDETGVQNIIQVLNLKREYCKLDSIYVITHNNELKSYFDDMVLVTKDISGDSRIDIP